MSELWAGFPPRDYYFVRGGSKIKNLTKSIRSGKIVSSGVITIQFSIKADRK